MIVSDVLTQALRVCYRLRMGQTADVAGSDMLEARFVANGILDAWKTSKRNAWSTPRMAFPLSAGVQQYTVGAGATINIPRPPRIDLASILLQGIELPMTVYYDAEEWQRIQLKGLGTTIPSTLYYDRAFPVGNIFLWPIPYGGISLVLYPWQQLDQFVAMTDPVYLPPSFLNAIIYSVAEELFPRLNLPVRGDVASKARQYRAAAQALNVPPPRMSADWGLMSGRMGPGGGTFPIIMGGNGQNGGSVATQWIPSIESPDGIRTVFSFAQPPLQVAFNGVMQFLGQGFVLVGSSQVQINLRDVNGSLIVPGIDDSIMAQVL